MTAHTLNFVEIENQTAFIDSRVYCRDVIMVDHHDWMNNVLYQYQSLIEQHFGVLRFQNAKPGVQGGRPEKYALLTEAQCNFALTLSRNTPEVVENKARLVADFEKAKQMIQANLERQLQASLQPSAETKALKAELEKANRYISAMTRIHIEDNRHINPKIEIEERVLKFLAYERPEVMEHYLSTRNGCVPGEIVYIGGKFGYFEQAKNLLRKMDTEDTSAYEFYQQVTEMMEDLNLKSFKQVMALFEKAAIKQMNSNKYKNRKKKR